MTKLQKSTALATVPADGLASGVNFYKNHFKQGATIVPRNFYFVSLDSGTPPDWDDRIVSMHSDEANEKDGKMPWKALTVSGQVNTKYLFRTAIARNIVPFGLIAPPLVVLPVKLYETENHSGTTVKLLDPQKIMTNGDLQTSRWFRKVDELWNKHKTESSAKMSFLNRIDFQRGLTDQNLNKRYLVLYTSSAKDANALVSDRRSLDLHFLADHKAYIFETNDPKEAAFLACFLNSSVANIAMKPFQSSGLFGPRDVHKKILDVPLPQFKADDKTHLRLAELGRGCAECVEAYIVEEGLANQEYNVGKVRSEIRNKLLVKELREIDEVLGKVIGLNDDR